jgi:hypothetical protein
MDALAQKIREMKPLILIGMHRSGTSLTVRLLTDLGMHMGNHFSRDAEAIYFQKINRQVYHAVSATWGFVDPLLKAMKSQAFMEKQTERILDQLFHSPPYTGRGISRFFGRQSWQKLRLGEQVDWGWKDPRTTITFPIWLHVFPQARFLHILRNGIDVAISIHRRSLKQKSKLWKRMIPLDYCPETLDFNYCFRLWEKHLYHVLENRQVIEPENYLEIRYEDLLANPELQLKAIARFAELPVLPGSLAKASQRININRLDNSLFAEAYQDQIKDLKNSPMMRHFNYQYFEEASPGFIETGQETL